MPWSRQNALSNYRTSPQTSGHSKSWRVGAFNPVTNVWPKILLRELRTDGVREI